MIYQVAVIGLDGKKLTIDLCDNEKAMQRITVGELKDKIKTFPCYTGCAKDDLILIFENGRLEDDTKRLVDYGIIHLSCIQMSVYLGGGGDGFETDHTGC